MSQDEQDVTHSHTFRTSVPLLLLIALPVHLALVWYPERFFALWGLNFAADPATLQRDAVKYMIVYTSMSGPAVFIILYLLATLRGAGLRRSLVGESLGLSLQVFVAAVFASVLLDFGGIWPFVWRWRTSAMGFVAYLTDAHAWLAVLLLVFTLGVLNPIIEEILVRFGVLQTCKAATHSGTFAVVFSGLVFTILHFGPLFRPNSLEVAHGARVLVFSLFASWLTVRRSGHLGLACALHSGRNVSEQLMVLIHVANAAT